MAGTKLNLDVGSLISVGIGLVTGLFSSKKHYHLYYFEEADDTWHFVLDGHPSQVNPAAKQYQANGIKTAIVRNKDGKYLPGELAPKEPPTGYTPNSPLAGNTNIIMIIAVVAAVAFALFMILRKKRKR